MQSVPPELREQIAGATLQALARRDEVMDEAIAAITTRAGPPLDWQQPRNAVLLDLPAAAAKLDGDVS